MPKQSKIRISKQDRARIKKLNRSISNKKSRLKRKFGLEMQIETRPITSFKTRKELNAYIKTGKTFTNRSNFRYVKNEHGVVFRREEVEQARREVEKINKERERFRKKVEKKKFTRNNKSGIMTVADRIKMRDTRFQDLKPLKFNIDRFRNQNEFQRYLGGVGRGVKENPYEQLINNYINSLETVFGRDAQQFADFIRDMEPEDFALLFYTEDIIDINGFNYNQTIARETKLAKLANVLGIEME